jgi:hypothetical protein
MGNLSNAMVLRTTLAKLGIRLIVNKGGFYSRLASDEITTHGYRVLTFAKCTTIMIAMLAVARGMGSSFD